ncbi:MAG: hypothetical protein EOP49_30160, partial [Sphingobacteriales bacterium]
MTFAPSATGSASTTVHIGSNDTDESDYSFGITANGTLGTPHTTAATNVQYDGFTANWDALPGATSYRLDVSTSPTFGTTQTATDLFISEYIEGSSNNKYIEIYNGTGAAVNLADYRLRSYSNGSTTAGQDVLLSGTLANGATIVYKNSAATIYAGAATNNGAVNFSGNDAVALFKISTNSNVDIFGRIGTDPGTAWTSGSFSTLDKTLVRNANVTGGVTTNPATGFPTLATEWTQFNVDTTTNLGSHTFNASTPSFVTGYENLTVSGTSQLVNGPEITPSTTYYYRVRGVSGAQTSVNSTPVISVTTLAAPPTFGSISQVVATVCDGGQATFNVTGLLPSTTSTLTFNIDSQPSQTVNVSANAAGFGTFSLGLSIAQNGQVLTVTSVDRTDAPGNATAVTSNNTVTLAITPNTTYYADLDNDGFGNPNSSTLSCTGAPQSYVTDNTDCNDAVVYYEDLDNDGFGSAVKVACGTVTNNLDCNDNQLLYADDDGDGFGSAIAVACGGVTNNSDCDDTAVRYADADGDGFGSSTVKVACGGVANNTDCDDNTIRYADADG